MALDFLPAFIRKHYEVHEFRPSCAILKEDFPHEWGEILTVLTDFRFKKSWLTTGGGSKSQISGSIDSALYQLGWEEKEFQTKGVVDETSYDSPTHKIEGGGAGCPILVCGITPLPGNL
ncbi:MAG: hypothetical protein A2508_03505 [Candidatus Lambdaproteobacteria bacterium RIFOXYD12_FULL_49_8]|uniref:Uncharacterized protein n=1 Tax=Candidatus Lambdaproteobacteria bacterium RIFOXYD2_FULL_50_16 TaxID=1817772 RepID=A0A1F6GD59_9PROT|nr:MAG: hypothetical protein A2527_12045 [Candidatus Lambdaproteobacteria bacterium RIFOXYD2_FULL_50_16]OGG96253.1 MAG: hypothetical protein A2508_03505 [Candidatus Lambdaproteobacteria bacterium RIFOXYD12_FULL_49_8]